MTAGNPPDAASSADAAATGHAIGAARPRPDAPAKVRGATRFTGDRRLHGLLHARPVLARRAHGRIAAIDAAAALEIPGVVAVLSAADLPLQARGHERVGQPLARSEVVFAGEPVALVVARTPEAAEDAAELVDVRLEPLPSVLDPEAAMDPVAPHVRVDLAAGGSHSDAAAQAHAAVGGGGDHSIDAEQLSDNVMGRHRYRNGDAGAALAGAAIVREATFTTSWMHQAYLEPQVSTAWIDADGTLVVESSTQALFSLQSEVAKALSWPQRRVRAVAMPIGGAFGGKWPLLDTLTAAAAVRLRRPVRLALTRSEDFAAANPGQPFSMRLRVGADRAGHLLGIEARIVADAGAYDEGAAEGLAGVLVAGPYAWPACDINVYGVRSNRFGSGAYRAPSGPPTAFAIESLLDEIALELGLDPVELRRRNVAAAGSAMVDGDTWPEHGAAEVLDALERSPVWVARAAASADLEGVGMALGYWPGATNAAAAACRMSPDGSIQVLTGVADMSGVAGGFQAIVADVLDVDPDTVQVLTLDSSSAPASPGSGGSTVTYSAGRAIRRAAEATARRLLEAASLELEIGIDDLELVGGTVRPRGTPDKAIPIAKLVRANARAHRAPIEGHASTEQPGLAPSVAGHVARVRVDRETGSVTVLELHVVQDVGRVLNPALVAAQQHGALVQGIGWATLERLLHDEHGQLVTGSFLDYAVPRAADVGRLSAVSVEVPAPDGPFGARGIGEAPVIAAAAAIANAVAAATGVRLRELPMSAPRVWRALQSAGTRDA